MTASLGSSHHRIHEDLLTLRCKGTLLYDSSVAPNGTADTSFGLAEMPVSSQTGSFVYSMSAQDLGPRSGPRAQIAVETADGQAEAFRDALPSFRVVVSVDRTSAARRGRPLREENVPPFTQIATRTAKVVTRSGAVPFAVSTCTLRISPGHNVKQNCRVNLSCGGQEVYGAGTAGTTGFNDCVLAAGAPVSFEDPNPTPTDDDPMLKADLAAGTATLGDKLASGATYSVAFTLSEP